jgi:hypothetical protein
MRAILIAATVTIWILVIFQVMGFHAATLPAYVTCAQAGYESTDLGLAQCADHYGWPCGSPYTDPLRLGCT